MEKLTAEQVQSYRDRRVAEILAKSADKQAAIEALSGVVRELVSVAKTNPIIGVILGAVVTDVLASLQIISPRCELFCFGALGVAFGVSVASQTVDIIGSVISAVDPFKSGGPTPPDPADLIKPVATTFVENPLPPPPGAFGLTGSGASSLAALLPKVVP